MEGFNEEQKRKLVYSFMKVIETMENFTVKHFLKMGMKRSSLYEIIGRYEKTGTAERKKGSGRKCVIQLLSSIAIPLGMGTGHSRAENSNGKR